MSCTNWKKAYKENISCSCSSWKDHIERHSPRMWPMYCSIKECNHPAIFGMPVMNLSLDIGKVIPVCDVCVRRTTYFDIKGNVSLVNINRFECKK